MENTELYYTIQIYSANIMIILLLIVGFVMGLAWLCNKFWNRRKQHDDKEPGKKTESGN